MRFFLVLLGLLVAPFALSVAQGQGHSASQCAALRAKLSTTPANAQALVSALKKCPAPPPADDPPAPPADDPPPPPPPADDPPPAPEPTGTSAIDGRAYNNITGRPGLVNWTVVLSGTVNRTAATNATGNYAFAGLPAGDYTVCLAVQDGWVMTMPGSWGPACPTGFGYFFSLADMNSATFVNFAVVVAP